MLSDFWVLPNEQISNDATNSLAVPMLGWFAHCWLIVKGFDPQKIEDRWEKGKVKEIRNMVLEGEKLPTRPHGEMP